MRLGLRGLAVSLLSLFVAIACLGGENQCLNPHPELPSCGSHVAAGDFGGKSGVSAGGTNNGGSSFGVPPAMNAGGSVTSAGPGTDSGDAGSGAESAAGAGGDTAVIPGGGGTGGAAGASGAAGADEGP